MKRTASAKSDDCIRINIICKYENISTFSYLSTSFTRGNIKLTTQTQIMFFYILVFLET